MIKRITGVTVNTYLSREILYYLGRENLAKLAYHSDLQPYLLRRYPNLAELLVQQADQYAVHALRTM